MGIFGKKQIRVEFFDQNSQKGIGMAMMKASKIPESWDWETDIIIDKTTYELVRVSPEERKRMKRDGLLQVWVKSPDAPDAEPVTHENDSLEGIESTAYADAEARKEEPEENDAYEETAPLIELKEEEEVVHASTVAEEAVNVAVLTGESEDLLHAFPTIADPMPEVNPAGFSENPFLIHPELWRQIECVPVDARLRSEAAFQEIRRIYQEKSVYHNDIKMFREIFLREIIRQPLDTIELKWEAFQAFFPEKNSFDGILMEGQGILKDAFAFTLPSGIVLYGQNSHQVVTTIGISGTDEFPEEALARDLEALEAMMKQFRLELVDWVDLIRLSPEVPKLSAYFQGTPIPE